MPYPSPDKIHPIRLPDGKPYLGTVFLNAAVTHPCLTVGDYTYASTFEPPDDWVARLAPYLFDFSPERLIIGKFCQIADGVQFITASANHRYDGISSYPFAIFDEASNKGRPSMPEPGANTVIGNDVWIGQGVRILPGAQVGDGVILGAGAGAVVSGQIAPYSIVGGNPARMLRMRFNARDIETLLSVAWWDWPIALILRHEGEISGGDVDALAAVQTG